ncbi:hypothetical protein S40293_00623 [Stachybotrys chartarum IBT 40293]|nr:hypothetical protein S40293_00623 [Stachybotrys chartarum IBT 40293]
MAPYKYKPLREELEEIRLVHLLPGTFNDPIAFRLVHVPMPLPPPVAPQKSNFQIDDLESLFSLPWELVETKRGDLILFNVSTGEQRTVMAGAGLPEETTEYEPRFEALSYTWGTDDVSEFAQVKDGVAENGSGQVETLGLRPNLASALRHLRHMDEERVLWIDAICINQDDIGERNKQVKRMATIYTVAFRVTVWLGEESSDSKVGLQTLQYVGQQLDELKTGRLIAASDAADRLFWRNEYLPPFTATIWDALSHIVERPWFYRLWCWQEMKLGGPRTVLQCGFDIASWRDVSLAVNCLHSRDQSPLVTIDFRERCRHISFSKLDHAGFTTQMLDLSRSKGCADPRDKIYGLLGMTTTTFRSRITVDYLMPVEEVYRQTFLAHLSMTHRLEFLKHCDLNNRQIKGPSWVPDWSRTEFAAPLLSEQMSSGISRAWYTLVDPGVLDVTGLHQTRIQTISDAAPKAQGKTLLAIRKWYGFVPQNQSYVTGEDRDVAFILTLCMNRTRDRMPSSHSLSVEQWLAMLNRYLNLTEDSKADPVYNEKETANVIQKVQSRRFFTTEDGHIGTAPAGAKIGDSICLLLGTYAPTLLRKTPLDTYQVVGECYVHGLSDAVGMLGPVPDGWRAINKADAAGRMMPCFLNLANWSHTRDDPRLGPLPQEWEQVPYERRDDDPAIFQKFKNVETGELINHDPRLSPTVLESLGVRLQTFRLV